MDFIKGMDVSFVPQCLDEGMVVSDFDGTVMHPLELAQKYGVNSIRLRLWNEPENVPESKGYCSLSQTIAMAKQIKAYGLGFMLDFHYSDWWADPGQQRKPKAWENLTGEALEQAVYEFTKETLCTLKKDGLLPDIVQIGNEIRSGLLFPDGEWPNYESMIKLVNAGIRGAREAAGDFGIKIMIHLDQGGRYLFIKEWFDNAFKHGINMAWFYIFNLHVAYGRIYVFINAPAENIWVFPSGKYLPCKVFGGKFRNMQRVFFSFYFCQCFGFTLLFFCGYVISQSNSCGKFFCQFPGF